jgi:hypothetical protein
MVRGTFVIAPEKVGRKRNEYYPDSRSMRKQKNKAITDQNRSGTGQNKKGGWSMPQPPFGTFSVRF